MTIEYIVRVCKDGIEDLTRAGFFNNFEDAKKYAVSYRVKGFLVQVVKRTIEIFDFND